MQENSTALPTALTHSVAADQSALADYAKSDMIRWSGHDLSTSSSAISAVFSHKLCKIVLVLQSNKYTSAQLDNAVVTITGIKPTTTFNPQTGAIPAAADVTGTATTITPYKTVGNVDLSGMGPMHYEAIIPPQANSGIAFSITFNGVTTTVTPAVPTDNYVGDTKYTYTLNIDETGISMTSSISPWGTGSTASNPIGIHQRDIRKNPLWYVAEYNMTNEHTSPTLTMGSLDNSGYFYSWADALKLFSTSSDGATSISNYYNGFKQIVGKSGTWHLPTQNEWNSIIPGSKSDGTPRVNLITIASANGTGAVYSADCNLSFGYNDLTKGVGGTFMKESSYWYRKSSNLIYAVRYCNTDYCSVWKYEWKANGESQYSPSSLTISCTLIDKISVAEAQSSYGTTASNWESVYFGNSEYKGAVQRTFAALGGNDSGSNSTADTSQGTYCQYWSATVNDNTKAWNMGADESNGGHMYLYPIGKEYGRSVRLFRDNPEQDVSKNPLWYMAEYNVANSAGTQFGATDNDVYWFSWADAMINFSANRTAVSYDGYKVAKVSMMDSNGNAVAGTWHWPTHNEWLSVIPGISAINNYNYDATTGYYFCPYLATVNFGCNYETKTIGVVDNIFIRKVIDEPADAEYHAIRFLGTPYCSAWKYVFDTDKWIISATLIDPVENNENSVKWFYESKWSSIYFGNDPSKGALQRRIRANGMRANGTGSDNITNRNSGGYYACTTEYANDGAYYLRFGQSRDFWIANDVPDTKTRATAIRLFRDN